MALTVEQAAQAGELARKIQSLEITVDEINQAIRDGATMTQIVASTTSGVFQTNWQMTPKDTGVALEMLKKVYSSNLADLTRQLSLIGV